jgi:hypothetical protein
VGRLTAPVVAMIEQEPAERQVIKQRDR